MILIMDTAGDRAFIGLWDDKWLAKIDWEAGRSLSSEIILKLEDQFKKSGKTFEETSSVIVAKGPGSFTGLRIGLSVANALAYGLKIPIVGVADKTNYDDILKAGQKLLVNETKFIDPVTPEYGREPNISKPKSNHS